LTDEQRIDWLRLIRSANVGPRKFLKQSATLVTETADIIAVLQPIIGKPADLPAEELESPSPGMGTEPDADARNRIVALLGPTPVAIDDLIRISGSSPAIVRTVLLELEIAGRLERTGGGMASLVSP